MSYQDENHLITTQNLIKTWSKIPGEHHVIAFYLEKHPLYGCFSNFYRHYPFIFTIPDWCGLMAGFQTKIEFSEKAIMLCKASLMNDPNSFNKILVANNPSSVKELGRQVINWDQKLWDIHVCLIAKEVIEAKFTQVDGLKEVLFLTKNHLIAEATSRDKIWGVGMTEYNPDINYPSRWKGANVLGWALMEVRDKLLEKAN